MKAAFLTFFAIGGFIASSIANPIGAATAGVSKRQDDENFDDLNTSLTTLLANIKEQTAIINATVQAAPENPTAAEATQAGDSMAPQFQIITDLLKAETQKYSKRSLVELVSRGCGKPCIFETVSWIIYELLCTVKFIIFKLGLGCVLVYLTPLVYALVDLLKCLDKVVAGLLFAVTAIVNELLKAVGLGLLGVVP
ncbi:hypothetical protein F4780DRAFT_780710 [Xylariomycetidae sp. FL0641]|nr:hypothetical protein F4780DRAFT_780710 [Xylariomycetidae sp. FL0641]